jgi:predicted nucleic acid-binding protein
VKKKSEAALLKALERNYPSFTPTEKNWVESGQVLSKLQADRGFSPDKLLDLYFEVLIALTARTQGATLIKSNRSDFEMIANYFPITLEIW